jgi:hypothetical protein
MKRPVLFFNLFIGLQIVSLLRVKNVKAIPVQTWIGPEISRRLRLRDFKTVGT